jgi:PAS domain-containing protein
MKSKLSRSDVSPKLFGNDAGDAIVICETALANHKQNEQALIEDQRKLRSILYGSPIPQFVLGKDHAVISWNGSLEKYTGISAESVIGTNQHWRAFYPSQRPCLADLIIDQDTENIPLWYAGRYGLLSCHGRTWQMASFHGSGD